MQAIMGAASNMEVRKAMWSKSGLFYLLTYLFKLFLNCPFLGTGTSRHCDFILYSFRLSLKRKRLLGVGNG